MSAKHQENKPDENGQNDYFILSKGNFIENKWIIMWQNVASNHRKPKWNIQAKFKNPESQER